MSRVELGSAGTSGACNRRQAARWAVAAALFGFLTAYASMRGPDRPGDFFAWYTAAGAVLDGKSPYDVIPAVDPERFSTNFLYPLPAAMLTVPFARLPYPIAGGLFVAIAAGLLAYGVSREGQEKLWLFFGAPFIVSASSGTWSLPIAAAAVVPALGFLAVAKPNVGVSTFLYRPTWWIPIGRAVLVAGSLMLEPAWPREWIRGLGGVQNRVTPILTPVGPLLLLALTRWRRPEARLLLGYACVPQAPWFYDQLVLGLIPATSRQALHYTVVTQLSLAIWIFAQGLMWQHGAWFLAAVLYLPPLIMILQRPNEGEIGAWAGHLMARVVPARWGGVSEPSGARRDA